jgi:hypothetical protein
MAASDVDDAVGLESFVVEADDQRPSAGHLEKARVCWSKKPAEVVLMLA